jgi:amino acid adenylation domain-containing protein
MKSTYLLHQAVANAADQYPDHTAVRFDSAGLTYQELAGQANSLAHVLIEHGVRRGDRVGIYMNKGLEAVTAVYGILAAGGAYVPLDPFAPAARLRYVIRDCGIRCLITKADKLPQIRQLLTEPTGLECLIGVAAEAELPLRTIAWDEIYRSGLTAAPEVATIEQDLAYILYTSGSTGVPKGIVHTHRSGLSFAAWAVDTYGVHHSDRLSHHAPLHFDLSTFDLFASALAGATTVVISESVARFPASLAKLMVDEQLTIWYSVPYALIQLLQRGNLASRNLGALRWVLFAGEPFPTKHLRQVMAVLPHARFSNLYGPTETNVCTYYHVPQLAADSDEPIPIGRPCNNVEALVVDSADQPVSPAQVGELLIRGPIVMRGYWGQPEKTRQGLYRREAFTQFEDLFYRTGDLVQLLPDGSYKYLGRKDRQIKARGYRVELDEIEVVLLAHAGVEEAAAFGVADDHGSNLIEACVILKADVDLTPEQLIAYLASRLPPYAVPAHLAIAAELPRTSTGKIDRRALQASSAVRISS